MKEVFKVPGIEKLYGYIYICLIFSCLALLHFADTVFFCKMKFCGNPASNRSAGIMFLTAFVHFVSLHHVFIILGTFQTHYYICYGDL